MVKSSQIPTFTTVIKKISLIFFYDSLLYNHHKIMVRGFLLDTTFEYDNFLWQWETITDSMFIHIQFMFEDVHLNITICTFDKYTFWRQKKRLNVYPSEQHMKFKFARSIIIHSSVKKNVWMFLYPNSMQNFNLHVR